MLENNWEKRFYRLVREGFFGEVLCLEGLEDFVRKCKNEVR